MGYGNISCRKHNKIKITLLFYIGKIKWEREMKGE